MGPFHTLFFLTHIFLTMLQVDYQGNVTLLTQSIYMSKCTMDVSYYPFDVQMCSLKFASWSTEVSRVSES